MEFRNASEFSDVIFPRVGKQRVTHGLEEHPIPEISESSSAMECQDPCPCHHKPDERNRTRRKPIILERSSGYISNTIGHHTWNIVKEEKPKLWRYPKISPGLVPFIIKLLRAWQISHTYCDTFSFSWTEEESSDQQRYFLRRAVLPDLFSGCWSEQFLLPGIHQRLRYPVVWTCWVSQVKLRFLL